MATNYSFIYNKFFFVDTSNHGCIYNQPFPAVTVAASAGNIKELSGVAWASVKKVLGIAEASLKKVAGVSAN